IDELFGPDKARLLVDQPDLSSKLSFYSLINDLHAPFAKLFTCLGKQLMQVNIYVRCSRDSNGCKRQTFARKAVEPGVASIGTGPLLLSISVAAFLSLSV